MWPPVENEARLLQEPDVVRDAGFRHIEARRDLARGAVAGAELPQDVAPRGIRQGLEDEVFTFHGAGAATGGDFFTNAATSSTTSAATWPGFSYSAGELRPSPGANTWFNVGYDLSVTPARPESAFLKPLKSAIVA
jgi:hypothetical protein